MKLLGRSPSSWPAVAPGDWGSTAAPLTSRRGLCPFVGARGDQPRRQHRSLGDSARLRASGWRWARLVLLPVPLPFPVRSPGETISPERSIVRIVPPFTAVDLAVPTASDGFTALARRWHHRQDASAPSSGSGTAIGALQQSFPPADCIYYIGGGSDKLFDSAGASQRLLLQLRAASTAC